MFSCKIQQALSEPHVRLSTLVVIHGRGRRWLLKISFSYYLQLLERIHKCRYLVMHAAS